MSIRPCLIVAVAGVLLAAAAARAAAASGPEQPLLRTWTDRTDTHHTEAAFVAVKDGTVSLEKDGTKIKVALDSLSRPDQEYVQRHSGGKPQADPTEATDPFAAGAKPSSGTNPADSPQQSRDGSPNTLPAKARIVFVGGDYTTGFAIFRRDLSESPSKSTRLTHVSFSKTAPAGKSVEKIPSISPKARPRWSPDGKRIAFIGGGPIRWGSNSSGLHGRWPSKAEEYERVQDIWVMDEDGRAVKPLVQVQIGDHGGIAAFRWSPDGTRIAFIGALPGGKHGLGVVDVKTRKIEQLPRGGMGNGRWLEEFCWSPDGKALVGINRSRSTMDEEVCVVSIDGRHTDITQGREFVSHPYWWPDGKITFCRGSGGRDFWIMNPDGSEQARIGKGRNIVEMPLVSTDRTEVSYAYPFWMSGDGGTIAFEWRLSDPNPRRRSVDVLCIKKVGESNLSKPTTCSLHDVRSEKGGRTEAYDVFFELQQ